MCVANYTLRQAGGEGCGPGRRRFAIFHFKFTENRLKIIYFKIILYLEALRYIETNLAN